jgi:hypothetical protein
MRHKSKQSVLALFPRKMGKNGSGARVTGRVGEKIAQNMAQPIFVKINTQLLPWKKVSLKIGQLLNFSINCPK